MINLTNNLMYQLDILNQQNTQVSNQMSSGKAISEGSDDSVLHAYILGLEDDIQTYEGILEQLEKTSVFNTVSDDTISEMKTLMESINSEVLTALNDTVNDETREIISVNIQAIKESLFNLVNEDSSGEYLYAGSDASLEPFVMNDDGSIDYVGDNSLKTTLVDKGLYKQQGVNGFDIMFFTDSQASNSETLEFTDNQRILDSNGDEWMFIDHTGDGNIDTDAIYLNGDENSTSMAVTDLGSSYSVTNTENLILEAKTNYFDTLDEIINALKLQDTSGTSIDSNTAWDILSNSLDEMNSAYDAINSAHAVLGGRNESFENYAISTSAKITNYQIFYQEFASADLTEAAIKAQSLETTYSALYSTISKINSLSLVNYM